MTSKKNIHVVPRAEGGWAAQRAGGERASSLHETQADAIQRAREMARSDGVELLIHGLNGQIRERDSYGHDPNPPRDRQG